jgi:hypothetical protein
VAGHAAVSAALERDLGERHGLGVTEFEVLERLAEDLPTQRAVLAATLGSGAAGR